MAIIREDRPFVVMPIRMMTDKNLEGIDYRIYGRMLYAVETDEKIVDVTDIAKELSKKLNENMPDIYKSLARLETQKYINTIHDGDDVVVEILADWF